MPDFVPWMLCTMPVVTTVKRLWNNPIYVKLHINVILKDVYVNIHI